MKPIFCFLLSAFCFFGAGCQTSYRPSPPAQSALAAVDAHVQQLVSREFDRVKPTHEDGSLLKGYFLTVAAQIDAWSERTNPDRDEVSNAVSSVQVIGMTPEARAVALACLDYYSPFGDPRDSSAVLQEIATEIQAGCPQGYPWWYLPHPKSKLPSPKEAQ